MPYGIIGRMTNDPTIRAIRSDRRRRTVTARLAEGGAVLEVLAPAGATDAELADHRAAQGAGPALRGEGGDRGRHGAGATRG